MRKREGETEKEVENEKRESRNIKSGMRGKVRKERDRKEVSG